MSNLVLDETNTSRNGTELVGESQDWGGNDYVFQVKTRLTSNGVTGIRGIGAVGAEARKIEAADGLAADADDAEAVQAVSNRSAWALLRTPLFRALWIASLTSSIGTWMHEVGAAWLMTSLTVSPVMVALMQTAASLPIVLLALPAGAIAAICWIGAGCCCSHRAGCSLRRPHSVCLRFWVQPPRGYCSFLHLLLAPARR